MLALDHVSKSFGPIAALSDVSVAFEPGQIHAICGENGAGKSTLVKILAGLHQPDAGSVLIDGRRVGIRGARDAQANGIAVVAQELSVCPELSVLDNIWLGSAEVPFFHRRADLRARAGDVLRRVGLAGIGLDTPARNLRLGERQLVEIARALVRKAHTLVLDEPTATLSSTEIAQIFATLDALKAEGCSIVYISHRLDEVFAISATITIMRNGQIVSTGPAAGLTREALIERMLGRSRSEMFPGFEPAAPCPGIVIRNLSVAGRLRDFSASVPGGSILCIAGQVGSGAVEVVNALAGMLHDATGAVSVAGRPMALGSVLSARRRNVMLISGDRAGEGIFLNLTVLDNLVAAALPRLSRAGLLGSSRLGAFADASGRSARVDMRRVRAEARQLSGGNQQKLAFARLLGGEKAGVLVMNEPTRGIDVGARAEIYRLMRDFCARGYAIILTSGDLEEIVGLGDRIVTLAGGRIVGDYARGEADTARLVADISRSVGHGLAAADAA